MYTEFIKNNKKIRNLLKIAIIIVTIGIIIFLIYFKIKGNLFLSATFTLFGLILNFFIMWLYTCYEEIYYMYKAHDDFIISISQESINMDTLPLGFQTEVQTLCNLKNDNVQKMFLRYDHENENPFTVIAKTSNGEKKFFKKNTSFLKFIKTKKKIKGKIPIL